MVISSLDRSAYMQSPATIAELLLLRATQEPDQLIYTFLADGEAEQSNLTYADLDLRARAIAAWLSSISAKGERALLLYPPGLDFVTAFFGCVYSGMTVIPAHPLDSARLSSILPRLQSIIHDAQPTVALTTAASLRLIEELMPDHTYLKELCWIATETIPDSMAGGWQFPTLDADALAILIYTSGSTASPKGVMLSHRNVLENERMVQNAYGYSRDTTFLCWVSHATAWGVINHLIQPVYAGARSILMAPEAFLQKPVRWLETISRYKRVTSGGANFSYELCVNRITAEERKRLDLTNWDWAVVAAEPVRAVTLDRFADAFGPCGFRREAFHPAYGLSEATMAVSDTPRFRGPRVLRVQKAALEQNKVIADPPQGEPASCIVSCGMPQPNQKVVVVEPNTFTTCLPGQVGEIWISGGNVAKGYWNKAEETDQTFHAFLRDTQEGPFLRTGDLGFFYDGELFVSGRLKDLIIIKGRNYYPQDIELTVEKCHKAIEPSSTAAFSIQTATEEHLVVVQELADPQQQGLEEIITMIRQAIFIEHEVLAHAVVLVRPGSIPKSSHGKLQRHACQAAYVAGKLDIIKKSIGEDKGDQRRRRSFAGPRTPTEKRLAEIWCELLEVEKIGIYDNFMDMGGHSITATQCLSRVRDSFEVELPIGMLFTETANVRELAEVIDKMRD